MNRFNLFLIVLLEGFVTISVEILTIRQLIPVVGNSVIVTSLIIGIFLLFLAYGYRKGGLYKTGYKEKLKVNFILSALWISIGLSYPFINFFFTIIPAHSLLILIFYLLLITAPIVYILGQTVPITIHMFQTELSTGEISGKILHLSTLGSFFGSVLTTLLLMNYFGVAWTVMANFFLLAILVLLLFEKWKVDSLKTFLLIIIGTAAYFLNVYFERSWFLATTSYADYRIEKDYATSSTNRGNVLVINESASSFINDKKQGFPYLEAIKKIIFDDLQLTDKKILVLGAGGFTLSAEKQNGNYFTYVDIDPEIAPLSEKYFIDKIHGEVVIEDARSYVKNTKKHFDVIISDAYTNRISIPAHLLTREHFINIKNALTPNGVAIFNMIARPTLEDSYSKRVDNTIRSVFSNCMAMPTDYKEGATNIIYVCKKTPEEKDAHIYTDDKNSSTMDFFNWK